MRHKTYLSPACQWDLTAALAAAEFEAGYYGLANGLDDSPLPGILFLCRARLNHRLFLKGDVVIAHYHANDEREPVWGVTSKGRVLRYYWVQLVRASNQRRWNWSKAAMFYGDRVAVEQVELPGRLVGQHPTAPDVRSFVIDSLRAGASERG